METDTLQVVFIFATLMITFMLAFLAIVIAFVYLRVNRWWRVFDRTINTLVPGPRRVPDLVKPRYTQDKFEVFNDGR